MTFMPRFICAKNILRSHGRSVPGLPSYLIEAVAPGDTEHDVYS